MPNEPTKTSNADPDRRRRVARFLADGYLVLDEAPSKALLVDLVDALDSGDWVPPTIAEHN